MFTFKKITIREVNIIKNWNFDASGSTVYMTPYIKNHKKGLTPLLGPDNCEGFCVWKKNELFGLIEYYKRGSNLEIGFVINPIFRGKGFGVQFINESINFGIKNVFQSPNNIIATTNSDNFPAINVLEKSGFARKIRKSNEITLVREIY